MGVLRHDTSLANTSSVILVLETEIFFHVGKKKISARVMNH